MFIYVHQNSKYIQLIVWEEHHMNAAFLRKKYTISQHQKLTEISYSIFEKKKNLKILKKVRMFFVSTFAFFFNLIKLGKNSYKKFNLNYNKFMKYKKDCISA